MDQDPNPNSRRRLPPENHPRMTTPGRIFSQGTEDRGNSGNSVPSPSPSPRSTTNYLTTANSQRLPEVMPRQGQIPFELPPQNSQQSAFQGQGMDFNPFQQQQQFQHAQQQQFQHHRHAQQQQFQHHRHAQQQQFQHHRHAQQQQFQQYQQHPQFHQQQPNFDFGGGPGIPTSFLMEGLQQLLQNLNPQFAGSNPPVPQSQFSELEALLRSRDMYNYNPLAHAQQIGQQPSASAPGQSNSSQSQTRLRDQPQPVPGTTTSDKTGEDRLPRAQVPIGIGNQRAPFQGGPGNTRTVPMFMDNNPLQHHYNTASYGGGSNQSIYGGPRGLSPGNIHNFLGVPGSSQMPSWNARNHPPFAPNRTTQKKILTYSRPSAPTSANSAEVAVVDLSDSSDDDANNKAGMSSPQTQQASTEPDTSANSNVTRNPPNLDHLELKFGFEEKVYDLVTKQKLAAAANLEVPTTLEEFVGMIAAHAGETSLTLSVDEEILPNIDDYEYDLMDDSIATTKLEIKTERTTNEDNVMDVVSGNDNEEAEAKSDFEMTEIMETGASSEKMITSKLIKEEGDGDASRVTVQNTGEGATVNIEEVDMITEDGTTISKEGTTTEDEGSRVTQQEENMITEEKVAGISQEEGDMVSEDGATTSKEGTTTTGDEGSRVTQQEENMITEEKVVSITQEEADDVASIAREEADDVATIAREEADDVASIAQEEADDVASITQEGGTVASITQERNEVASITQEEEEVASIFQDQEGEGEDMVTEEDGVTIIEKGTTITEGEGAMFISTQKGKTIIKKEKSITEDNGARAMVTAEEEGAMSTKEKEKGVVIIKKERATVTKVLTKEKTGTTATLISEEVELKPEQTNDNEPSCSTSLCVTTQEPLPNINFLKKDPETAHPIMYAFLQSRFNIPEKSFSQPPKLLITGFKGSMKPNHAEVLRKELTEQFGLGENVSVEEIDCLDTYQKDPEKWNLLKHVIFLYDLDEDFNLKQCAEQLKVLTSKFPNKRRMDVLWCRASRNTAVNYPSTATIFSLATLSGLLMMPFYHDQPKKVAHVSKYCKNRFQFLTSRLGDEEPTDD